jgi:hypothetical protein
MGLVDFDGEWGWDKLDADHVDKLHQLITTFEGESLADLKHGKQAKPIPVNQLCQDAQRRLPRIGLGDRERLWELRFGHKKWRAWGIVEGSTFNLLWWDPQHTVCSGLPKGVTRIS